MPDWKQPLSLEERLRTTFVPGPLVVRHRLWKEMRKGERELHLVPFLVDPDRAAIDVGANQGWWTLRLARFCRHVYAFEPSPKMFAMLRRNITLANVTLSQTALSDTTGSAELRVPRAPRGFSNQAATLSSASVHGEYGSVTVKTARLDELGLEDVGFIKIDVEGHEMNVLRGAEATLRAARPRLLIELEERHSGRPIEEMLAEVEGYGYQAFALTRHGLTAAACLDFDAQHRAPADRRDYLFNFVFLPRKP